jgi:hypothetical protein
MLAYMDLALVILHPVPMFRELLRELPVELSVEAPPLPALVYLLPKE